MDRAGRRHRALLAVNSIRVNPLVAADVELILI